MPARVEYGWLRVEGGIGRADPAFSPPGFTVIGGELPLIGSGTPASAGGATITATASILSGAASGPAVISGQTITTTASLIAGAANGPAAINGDTISSTASLIAGAVQGPVEIGGQTIILTTDVIAGTATGGAGGTPGEVSGDTLTATASLIVGTAGGAVAVDGQTITLEAAFFAGASSGPASVGGDLIVLITEIIGGGAVGDSGAAIRASFPQDGVIVLDTPLASVGFAPGVEQDTAIPTGGGPGVRLDTVGVW